MGDLWVATNWSVGRFIIGGLLLRRVERRCRLLYFNIIILVEGEVLFLLALFFIVYSMMISSDWTVNSSGVLVKSLIAIGSILGRFKLILNP